MNIYLLVLLLISGIFGITVSSIAIKNYKSNTEINIYFILFLMVLSLMKLGTGINFIIFKKELFSDFFFESNVSVLALTLIYFYFKNAFNENHEVKTKRILLHSIFPLFYIAISIYSNNTEENNHKFNLISLQYYLFFIYITTYDYLCIRITYKNLLNEKGKNKSESKFKTIYKWANFIYPQIIIITFSPLLLYCFKDSDGMEFIYQPITSVILIIVSCKIISCPEIFYGYNTLKDKISKNQQLTLKFDSFWIYSDKITPNKIQDLTLKSKIDPKLIGYINQIEEIIHQNSFFIRSDVKIKNLSLHLNIPMSHLNYIFKYHSKVTFIELKNIIKIHYATTLIQEDYLKSNTLNCLSKEVGFISYDPFYRNFKKITGTTPLDYYNTIRANKGW